MMKKLFSTIILLVTTLAGISGLSAQDATAPAEDAAQAASPNVYNLAYHNI